MRRKLYTVYVFAKLNTKRFFRDKTAIFFTVLFPLVFLFVFGGLFGKDNNVSFNVALINESKAPFAQQFVGQIQKNELFDIDKDLKTLDQANDKMSHGQLDATIILPKEFGVPKDGQTYPSGQAQVVYTQNTADAARTLASIMEAQFKNINADITQAPEPFSVVSKQSNVSGLSQFDYTFAGLLGFSLLGLGIFGPVAVFPELKKQGILRRLHTTPLRVWQYFVSTMIGNAIIGIVTIAVQFAVAALFFDLRVLGNYFELAVFLVLGIVMLLGIGLAVGGWARNERQAAPLGNLVAFPMMFLSGTFFPRYIMPEWLQNVTAFLPLTPVVDGLRLIATEGQSLLQVLPQVGLIVGWAIVVYAIAFRVFRWE